MRLLVYVAVAALATAPAVAFQLPDSVVSDLAVTNGGPAFAGDGRYLATISPDGDGRRDEALVRFRLHRPAVVKLEVAAVGPKGRTVFKRMRQLGKGQHVVRWGPRQSIPARTYIVRLTARDSHGNVSRYGFDRPAGTPVIHVLGVEAAFRRESYAPNSIGELSLGCDGARLTLELVRAGYGSVAPRPHDEVNGKPVAAPVDVACGRRGPRRLRVWLGDWPSGLYFAKLTDPRGYSTYAPVVLRPERLGLHRVAVVLPTYTWQAYNFRDLDGDGYGDTWYAGRTTRAELGRAYLGRGLPPFFRAYDLSFLLWLARSERAGAMRDVDFLCDADLDRASVDAVSSSYDLLVFPGHHEYVTRHEYLLVRKFRDRGGNLIFLSANNFFWRVDRRGTALRRISPWRELGRPESALLGVQYLASDRGGRKAAFVVRAGARAAWLLDGTGLRQGSRFGRFGIEIDRTTRHSPRGTTVIAEIPNLFGRGKTAQMTYYETAAGAKVFSAGAFTLAGYARYMPVSRMLENLWARLS